MFNSCILKRYYTSSARKVKSPIKIPPILPRIFRKRKTEYREAVFYDALLAILKTEKIFH